MSTDNAHSDWSPSSMHRLLACPASAELCQIYPKTENEYSNLGTLAHGMLEDYILFGIEPKHDDPDIVEGVVLVKEWVDEKITEYKEDMDIHTELRLAIPDTPVWGTGDLTLVGKNVIHVGDFKNGYLPVDVYANPQLLSYLVGAIAQFGPRSKYFITVAQPRYNHVDGPIRTWEVTRSDIDFFMEKLGWALNHRDYFKAGKHCKYCPACGECKVFAGYIYPRLNTAMDYDLTDKHAISNETMAALLDFADLAQGWISGLRSEAYRRALQDRALGGWKLVNGNKKRGIKSAEALKTALGKAAAKFPELDIPEEALYDQSLISAPQMEKLVRGVVSGRNKWKGAWEIISEAIEETRAPPALVRATDGRAVFKRGQEFSELPMQEDEEGGIV